MQWHHGPNVLFILDLLFVYLFQSIPKPSEVFHVGSLVMCKVKSSECTTSGGRPRIQVTVNPTDVNSQLTPAMLRNGMVRFEISYSSNSVQ